MTTKPTPEPVGGEGRKDCALYWGDAKDPHRCSLPVGHEGPHVCKDKKPDGITECGASIVAEPESVAGAPQGWCECPNPYEGARPAGTPRFCKRCRKPINIAPDPASTSAAAWPDPDANKSWRDPLAVDVEAAKRLLKRSGIRDVVLRHQGQPNEQTFSFLMAFFAVNHRPAPTSVEAQECYWPNGALKWGHPVNVRHLILQLQTLDPEMKVSSVTFIDVAGKRRARAYGLSMSRERWDEGGWLNYTLPVPECLAIWATEREEIDALTPIQLPRYKTADGQWYEVCGVNLRPVRAEDIPQEFLATQPQPRAAQCKCDCNPWCGCECHAQPSADELARRIAGMNECAEMMDAAEKAEDWPASYQFQRAAEMIRERMASLSIPRGAKE